MPPGNKYDENIIELTTPLQKKNIFVTETGSRQENKRNSLTNRFCVQCSINPKVRTTLWYLIFTGFAVNYMVRTTINMAIVNMIKMQGYSAKHMERTGNECLNGTNMHNVFTANNSLIANNTTNQHDLSSSTFTIERELLKLFGFSYPDNRFEWNEYQQNLILGSYYWLQWILYIPSGMLAKFYGTKLVFGVSSLLSCLICFLVPIAAYTSTTFLIILRVAQGAFGSFSYAPMHNLVAHWVPPNERSSFSSAYFGNSAGMAILLPLFGYMLSVTSWEWIFHLSGVIGIVWFCVWQYCIYDSPLIHPRIEEDEKRYILQSLGNTVNQSDEKPVIPWVAILKSKNVWVSTIAQFGPIWTMLTLTVQTPTFFKIIHGLSIETIGIITGVQHLLRIAIAILFSFTTDYLLRSDKLSRISVRRIAGTFSMIINGFCIVGLAFSDCNTTLMIVFIFLSAIVHSTFASGPVPNIIDNAPNFASIIIGINSTLTSVSGFISPYIVGQLTLNNQSTEEWKYVFLITAGHLFISGFVYVFFTDTKIAKWNSPNTINKNLDGTSNKCTKDFK